MHSLIACLVIIGIVGFVIFCFVSSMKPVMLRDGPCKKDPTKRCPYKAEMGANGGMRAYGHFQCCQVKDQLKALNKLILLSEKNGGTVGEFHFPKHIIEEAKEQEKFWDELDSSGPTELKK